MVANKEVLFIVALIGFTLTGSDATPPVHCVYEGQNYNHGDTWADKNGCDACTCGDYGSYCRTQTNQRCPLAGKGIEPLTIMCDYARQYYQVAEVFTTLDGCNKCLCTEQGMQCTARACSPNGFANGSKTPIFGECHYDNLWYNHAEHWLARDKCNTCICYQPGNYQGQHVCTKSICRCQSPPAVITG